MLAGQICVAMRGAGNWKSPSGRSGDSTCTVRRLQESNLGLYQLGTNDIIVSENTVDITGLMMYNARKKRRTGDAVDF